MTSFYRPSSARRFAAVAISLLALGASGCGSPATPVQEAAQSRMKVLGILYGMFASDRGGYPASEEQFISFLKQAPTNWDKLVAAPKELLQSPRNGEPLTVFYGSSVKPPAEGGFPWIAYETSAIDGKRLIVNARGSVVLVSDQEFSQLVPNPSK